MSEARPLVQVLLKQMQVHKLRLYILECEGATSSYRRCVVCCIKINYF